MPVSFKPKAEATGTTKKPPFTPNTEPEEVPNPLKKRKKKPQQPVEDVEEQKSVQEEGDGEEPSTKKSIFGKQGQASTTVKHPDGAEEHETEMVGGFIVAQSPLAVVSVNASATLNMGNYESLRIGCMVSLPCDKAEIDETFSAAQQFVEDKMDVLIKEHGPQGED